MTGRIKVEDAARFLRMDAQTLRIMIRAGLIPGATCFKRGKSKHYTYVIMSKPFVDATGYGEVKNEQGNKADIC